MRLNRTLPIVATLAALASPDCTARPAPTAPGSPPIRFSAVSPEPGTTLAKCTTVNLQVGLVSSADSPGLARVTLQDQTGAGILATQQTADIPAGGSATIRSEFLVPCDASEIRLVVDFRAEQDTRQAVKLYAAFPTK